MAILPVNVRGMEIAGAMAQELTDAPALIDLLTIGDKYLASYKSQMPFAGLHASNKQWQCASRCNAT